ncbi:hypothetical protein EYF80_017069 [Liparis tanakae]|uniref:Uncharacterized protein n=1 Tax=Liparis tanakae TaxID=230148 RepID=A0A4Z2I5Q3_9TELE|nr:hypothetical protein EYF80_017069 [Liparis tanakae]
MILLPSMCIVMSPNVNTDLVLLSLLAEQPGGQRREERGQNTDDRWTKDRGEKRGQRTEKKDSGQRKERGQRT